MAGWRDGQSAVCPYLGMDSVIERHEALTPATTRMDLENIMRVERSQAQRPRSICFHLCETSMAGKSTETESGSWLRGAAVGEGRAGGWESKILAWQSVSGEDSLPGSQHLFPVSSHGGRGEWSSLGSLLLGH